VTKLAKKIVISEMSWPEVEKSLKKTDIVLLPVGSTEEHGHHLPIDNDTFVAYEIAKRAAKEVEKDIGALVAPPVPFGESEGIMGFPGTISLRNETLVNVYKEVCKCLVHHGFKKIVFINGHGGNPPAISTAMNDVAHETGAFLACVNYWETSSDLMMKIKETELTPFHACELETSISLAVGQRVDMGKARAGVPPIDPALSDYIRPTPLKPKVAISVTFPTMKPPHVGTIGDPTKATLRKGERLVEDTVSKIASFLRSIKAMRVQIKKT